CIDVNLGGFLGVSEFGLQLADFLVFGGELSLSVSQCLCRSLFELLNKQRIRNGNLDDRITQDNRFSSRVSHVTSFINGSGRVAQLSIADRGSAPRITDSCLTASATTRHKG